MSDDKGLNVFRANTSRLRYSHFIGGSGEEEVRVPLAFANAAISWMESKEAVFRERPSLRILFNEFKEE